MKTKRSCGWDIRLGLALVLCTAAGGAMAGGCLPRVQGGWIRMLPGSMPMLGGFGRISNRCPTPAIIVRASSSAFADATLHESTVVAGMDRMRAVPSLRIAPHGAVELKPGGLHLMLMQPTTRLRAGGTVNIAFELQDGRTLVGAFELRQPGR